LGVAWRKTKLLFRMLVGKVLGDFTNSIEDIDLVSLSERWTCPEELNENKLPLAAVHLSDEQLAWFWAATSPKIDAGQGVNQEIDRAKQIEFGDLNITPGMKNVAEIFIGTVLTCEKYASLKERYLAFNGSSERSRTEDKNTGKKIPEEDHLLTILDLLTKQDSEFPEEMVLQIERLEAEKRGIKRKRQIDNEGESTTV